MKAGFAVVREDGTMLAASPATPLGAARDGTLRRAFGIPLDGLPAGRYELVVVAEEEASGERAEVREAFVVSSLEDRIDGRRGHVAHSSWRSRGRLNL